MFHLSYNDFTKKSLKRPKGQSESVYERTDNTMVKRKSTKGKTTIYKRKLNLNIDKEASNKLLI
jgi:hypothetical protein